MLCCKFVLNRFWTSDVLNMNGRNPFIALMILWDYILDHDNSEEKTKLILDRRGVHSAGSLAAKYGQGPFGSVGIPPFPQRSENAILTCRSTAHTSR